MLRKNNFQNKYKLPFKDKIEVFSLKNKINNKIKFLTRGNHLGNTEVIVFLEEEISKGNSEMQETMVRKNCLISR